MGRAVILLPFCAFVACCRVHFMNMSFEHHLRPYQSHVQILDHLMCYICLVTQPSLQLLNDDHSALWLKNYIGFIGCCGLGTTRCRITVRVCLAAQKSSKPLPYVGVEHYCITVNIPGQTVLYCGRVSAANAPGCTAAEGLLYKHWSLVVPTCTARCLHQRP